MDVIYDGDKLTKEGRPTKASAFRSPKLTEQHLAHGSLKGLTKAHSDLLRCDFYLRPGKILAEVEQFYIDAQNQSLDRLKNGVSKALSGDSDNDNT